MNLVFIYGPPAVGKLTVAEELGKLTSYAVFDNHLSVDCVLPVFPWGNPSLMTLVLKIRLLVLEQAARENVDVIFTFVYWHPKDVSYVDAICGAVEQHGGRVLFVQLTCDREEQERRVQHEARLRRKKINSLEYLRDFQENKDLFTPIPDRESLRIDTTHRAPPETARLIATHFNLAQQ